MNRIQFLLDIAENHGMYVQLVKGYAEPSYPDCPNGLALGDWNDKKYKKHPDIPDNPFFKYNWRTNTQYVTDNTPSRISNLLEKLGVEVDWYDEYEICEECNRAFRTQGDSYNWTQYGYTGDGWSMCGDCIKEDPENYLEALEGSPHKALTFDINMEDHEYINICVDEEGCRESWENGLYGGQCDTPIKVAESLEIAGIVRYIFEIDNVGQFDLQFSVWVHNDDLGLSGLEPWEKTYAAIEDLRIKIQSKGSRSGGNV